MKTIQFNGNKDVWRNGFDLAEAMLQARKATGAKGFFFDFGLGEVSSHKKFSSAVQTDAGFMMAEAQRTSREIRIFKNMNGEIAAAFA